MTNMTSLRYAPPHGPLIQDSHAILDTLALAHNHVIKHGKTNLTFLEKIPHETIELNMNLVKGIGISSLTIIVNNRKLSTGTSEC